MRPARLLVLLAAVLLLWGAAAVLVTAGPRAPEPSCSIVDPVIIKHMALSADGQARFIVRLRPQADLSAAFLMSDRVQRGQVVYESLSSVARHTQTPLLAYLAQQQATGHVTAYRSFWIFNGIAVTGDRETLDYLASFPEVESIGDDHYRRWLDTDPPTPTTIEVTAEVTLNPTESPSSTPTPTPSPPGGVEWNIALVNADDVWHALGIDGTGIVVANLDTGVLYTHPALVSRYRGRTASGYDHDYNWYDATGHFPDAPDDDNGHGTHTMGIILGDDGRGNQIGVAPGARWIAVKAFDGWGFGYESTIHAGFQWLLAPTDRQGHNPDPSLAPQVVNNSWGNSDSWDTTFQDDVRALLAAGIVPIFAAGNEGPGAGSISAPADYSESWAVGATDADDQIAYFSGRGPSPFTTATKPEFCAPGVQVRSSWTDGDYAYLSGTSMAAPHVAGLTALILQAAPHLTLDEVQGTIASTAVDLGDPGPDYTYGWGRIDAYNAVLLVSTAGTLTGQVTDGDTGAPVAEARVAARFQADGRVSETTSDAQGVYTLTLAAGRYDMSVRKYGYLPLTVTVAITTDEVTTRDIVLPVAPLHTLAGHVTDAATGAPLAATVAVLDTPLDAVTSDPATGFYSVTVAQGTYDILVKSRGYESLARTIAIEDDTTADFPLVHLPPILLVDDDGGDRYEEYFTATLDSLGEEYDYWEAASLFPTLDTLEQYPMVIWTTGADGNGGHVAEAEDDLAAYLDGGGMLFLSSASYARTSSKSFFVRDYLHLEAWNDTMPNGVSGAPDNPVGAWLGPYTLAPPFQTTISSLNYDELSSPAFFSSYEYGYGHWPPVAVTYFDRQHLFRTVYFGFPFEALQPPDAAVVMRRILTWFRSDASIGTLRGVVTDSRTDAPLAGATVAARSPRDNLTVATDVSGTYTMPLLADVYSLHVEQAGYIAADLTSIAVSPDAPVTRNVALRPHVVITPAALTVTLMAGRTTTRTLTIGNSAPSTLTYAIYEGTAGEQTFPPPYKPSIANGQAPVFDIPYSAVPTVDGTYTPGEWDDAAVFHLTPYDDPGGEAIGAAYIAHSADYLYVLLDYFGRYDTRGNIGGCVQIYVQQDLYHEEGRGYGVRYFSVSINDGEQNTSMSSPGEAQAGRSATPDDPIPHWIFEFAISISGLEVQPSSGLGIYFDLWGDAKYEYGEWYNSTTGYDLTPTKWAVGYLDYGDVPWVTASPLTGTVAAADSRPITLTFDAAGTQPGTYTIPLLLTSLDYRVIVADPYVYLTVTVVPSPTMGWLTGRVGDRRTGEPVIASVSAPGLGAVTTDAAGEYLIWLTPGPHLLTVSAVGYLSATATVTVAPQTAALPHDFALCRDSPQIAVLPSPLTLTATWGSVITHALTISNGGPRPLTFQLHETTADDDLPLDVTESHATSTAWPQRTAAARPSNRVLADVRADAAEPLSPFLFDAQGDGEAADLILGEAAVGERGWDGEPAVLTLRLTFAPDCAPRDVVGYVYLDTDRNPDTGFPPDEMAGSPGHDIGSDYYLDLFAGPSLGLVDVWRRDAAYQGSVPIVYGAHSITISLPLSLLGNDDGRLDIALALGTTSGVEEWSPETAHATIGVEAGWLAESPADGTLPAHAERAVTLTLDTGQVQPGEHRLRLLAVSDDPQYPQVYLPLTVTVLPAPTMGRLTGFVTGVCRQGIAARVAARDFPATVAAPGTGHYTLWLDEGEHEVRAALASGDRFISHTVAVHITAQGTTVQDFGLPWCGLYLPLTMRGM